MTRCSYCVSSYEAMLTSHFLTYLLLASINCVQNDNGRVSNKETDQIPNYEGDDEIFYKVIIKL